MIVTHEWLREFVDPRLSIDELATLFTRLGYGVERLERFGQDAVYELEVPANRPELLSVVGLAREAATALGLDLKAPHPRPAQEGPAWSELLSVELECPDLCPRYTARVVEGVRVGPSPDWMARRLERVGIRPVNNVVDITNYVLWETGQPLHAFDLDRLAGRALVIRRPRAGESIVAIDGRTYALAGEVCVIADAERAVAIGGVMGGQGTEISLATRTVALESARFDPVSIRRTSRALGLATPSSRRFERGVSWEGVEAASRRAAELLMKLAGGRLARGMADLGSPGRPPARTLWVRRSRIRRVLGLEVPPDRVEAILRRMGFVELREQGETLVGTVPEWRADLAREEDVIEEIARFVGYDAIPEDVSLTAQVTTTGAEDRFRRRVREALRAMGAQEVLTWSFADEALDPLLAGAPLEAAIALRDPRGGVARWLRRSLAPGLLRVLETNERYKQEPQAIFEVAKVYGGNPGAYEELERLGIAVHGGYARLRGILEGLLRELGARVTWVPRDHPACVPGRSAQPGPLGWAGEIRAGVLKEAGLRGDVAVAEIDLAGLRAACGGARAAGEISRFEAVRRDVAVEVGEAVTWAQVERAVREAGAEGLEEVECFDVYRGAPIPAGSKSVAFRLSFRRADRAVRAAEAEAGVERIARALAQRLSARRR